MQEELLTLMTHLFQ